MSEFARLVKVTQVSHDSSADGLKMRMMRANKGRLRQLRGHRLHNLCCNRQLNIRELAGVPVGDLGALN